MICGVEWEGMWRGEGRRICCLVRCDLEGRDLRCGSSIVTYIYKWNAYPRRHLTSAQSALQGKDWLALINFRQDQTTIVIRHALKSNFMSMVALWSSHLSSTSMPMSINWMLGVAALSLLLPHSRYVNQASNVLCIDIPCYRVEMLHVGYFELTI